MKAKELLKISSIPILLASLCCLSPIVLVLLGISSVAYAASLTTVLDGQYKWVFVLSGSIALLSSLILYFRKRGICTLDQAKRERNEIVNTVVIVFITTVGGYIVFFHLFLHFVGKVLSIWR